MTETSANALQRGLANRRRVLGDEWVDQSVARANELNVEFQRMITAYAWIPSAKCCCRPPSMPACPQATPAWPSR
jgi:hypothetical protein